jgi:hypothetical protein
VDHLEARNADQQVLLSQRGRSPQLEPAGIELLCTTIVPVPSQVDRQPLHNHVTASASTAITSRSSTSSKPGRTSRVTPPTRPGVVRHLIERKQSLFVADSRFIFDVRTQQDGDRVHVMAASGLARRKFEGS